MMGPPDPYPEIDFDEDVIHIKGKYPLNHSNRSPDDKNPLLYRISSIEKKFEGRFDALLIAVYRGKYIKAGKVAPIYV